MTVTASIEGYCSGWKVALQGYRASLPHVARPPRTAGMSVWLPGHLRDSAASNANEFMASLEALLHDEGITVVRPTGEQQAISMASKCDVVIGIGLSVGTSAEAVDFANNDPPKSNLFVFLPVEFHGGYVRKVLDRQHVQLQFFALEDVTTMRSTLPLQVIRAIETQCSLLTQEARREERDRRCSVPATVIFIDLRGVRTRKRVRYAPDALAVLDRVVRLVTADQPGVSIHSALCGAIIVAKDAGVDVTRVVRDLASRATSGGLAIRIGITHGDVDRIGDIDGTFNFVGPAVNRAARIAVANVNPGVLLDASYVDHACEHACEVALGPQREVPGKRDEVFACRRYSVALRSELNVAALTQEDHKDVIDAVFLAYDLPRFSDGDRWLLVQRTTEVAHAVWESLTAGVGDFYFSPGGDGGVIVIPLGEASVRLTKEDAYKRAVQFHEELVRRSRTLAPAADVTCRVGLHYGQARLYGFGRRLRPAGAHLFAADALANDAVARAVHGVVVSDAISEALSGGSSDDFKTKFTELAAVQTPVGRLRRFVRAT